jgi:hypothetical protein
MHLILRLAMFFALPTEVVNFWIIGYPAQEHRMSALSHNAGVALEWYVLHFPGIILSDRSQFLRLHPVPCSLVFLIIGYIDTVILFVVIIAFVRLALHTLRRLSSPLRHAH